MANFELINALKEVGLSDKDVQYVVDNVDGVDLINLVMDLNKSSIHDSYEHTWEILKKYGVAPQQQTSEKLEMTAQHAATLIEWLKSNNVEYTMGAHGLKVHGVEPIVIEQVIGEIMKNGKDGKLARQAKRKLDNYMSGPKRDANFQAAMQRKNAGVHANQNGSKDVGGRGAKHKKDLKRSFDEDRTGSFESGEKVTFEDHEAIVSIPNGPNGTVGILLNNKLKMVGIGQIHKLDESVLGISTMDTIGRLRELAGIRTTPTSQDVKRDFRSTIDEAFEDMDADPYGLGAEDEDEMGEIVPVDGIEPDPAQIPPSANPPVIPPAPAAPVPPAPTAPIAPPNAVGGVDVIGAPVVPTSSQAYSQILDHLNNIQKSLADIRLSEYRSLLQKLDDLSTQVRNMGRDYLGESRGQRK